jgi:hypothetical protein
MATGRGDMGGVASVMARRCRCCFYCSSSEAYGEVVGGGALRCWADMRLGCGMVYEAGLECGGEDVDGFCVGMSMGMGIFLKAEGGI